VYVVIDVMAITTMVDVTISDTMVMLVYLKSHTKEVLENGSVFNIYVCCRTALGWRQRELSEMLFPHSVNTFAFPPFFRFLIPGLQNGSMQFVYLPLKRFSLANHLMTWTSPPSPPSSRGTRTGPAWSW
jgi:hypothetical protein